MTVTASEETRQIALEIAHNVRHLGGYSTADGALTSAVAIRSASLHRLTDNGVEVLRQSGVTAVIDFRSRVEREREASPPLERHGVQHIAAPVFEEDASPTGQGQNREFTGFTPVYERFLNIGENAYRTLFQTLAETEGRVLFHCAAGKDRTGVAAALILGLAGVDDETIVTDYAQSEVLLSPLFSQWLPKMAERGISDERARALMASPAPVMSATLTHIRTNWGSAEGYLTKIGVTQDTISAVRARIRVTG
jgi:protein-tyrosine phosphatase